LFSIKNIDANKLIIDFAYEKTEIYNINKVEKEKGKRNNL
jgi:hypothetical protein